MMLHCQESVLPLCAFVYPIAQLFICALFCVHRFLVVLVHTGRYVMKSV